MDYFNISSELAKAKEPAFKSGMLKRYAKGGFTGRSEYKRSIENDIRVGMYAEGGLEGPIPNPNPVPPVYDIRAHTNPVEMMYGSAYTPIDIAKKELEKQFILPRNMAPVIPSTGKLNLQAAPQVGKYNVVRDAQGNIIQPSLSVMAEGGPIRPKPRPLSSPIYTSNPNDPRLRAYNDSLSLYNIGENQFAEYNEFIRNNNIRPNRTRSWTNPFVTGTINDNIQPIEGRGFYYNHSPDVFSDTNIPSNAFRAHTFRYTKPFQPVQYADPKIVKKQKQLKEAGLYSGKLDGIWGPKSEEAWKQYEEASKPKPAPVVNKPTTTSAPRAEIVKDERYYLPRNRAPRLPSGKMNPQVYRGSGNTPGIETDASGNPIMANGGLKSYAKAGLIKRADGSYSRKGLWDNIRANKGSGKKPTKQMLQQERKIKAKTKYEEGGINGDPVDENELIKKQIKLNQLLPSYTEAEKRYKEEADRVSNVRKNVIVEADKLNAADDKYRDALINWDEARLPEGYSEFINARNPQELEAARKKLPEEVRKLLPNDGKYSVAQWNPETNSWRKGAEPDRELYCTPYGCFTYQKAGAKDVPIIPGNLGFEAKAKTGEIPFEKIDPTKRESGDIGLMVEMSPADYINNPNKMIRRPHHTAVYAQPDNDESENTKKGFFYNVIDGQRLMYDVSMLNTDKDPNDRIDYYRYVGKTKKLKSELDKLSPEKEALEKELSMMYDKLKMPSQAIKSLPEQSSIPNKSQPIKSNLTFDLKNNKEYQKELKKEEKYQREQNIPPNLQLFGKGGYRVSRTSERKGKTHKVTGPDGSVKYFGDPSMGERSKSKYGKDAFYKRHAKSLKKNPHFRAYAKATWSDGGLVSESDLFNLSSY